MGLELEEEENSAGHDKRLEGARTMCSDGDVEREEKREENKLSEDHANPTLQVELDKNQNEKPRGGVRRRPEDEARQPRDRNETPAVV